MSEQISLSEVANQPEQIAAVLWTKARAALETYPGQELQYRTDGDSHFLITPPRAYVQSQKKSAKGKQPIVVSVGALINNPNEQTIADGSPLYLIINDNVHKPAIQFDRYLVDKPAAVVGSDSLTVSEEEVCGAVNMILQEAGSAKSRLEYRRRYDRDRRMMVAKVCGALLFLGSAVVGGLQYYDYVQDRGNEEARRAVEQFDARRIELPGDGASIGETTFTQSFTDIDIYQVPLAENGLKEQPRRFEVIAGTCRRIDTITTTEAVKAVMNTAEQLAVVSVSTVGEVQICGLDDGTATDNDERSTSLYSVAMQLTNRTVE